MKHQKQAELNDFGREKEKKSSIHTTRGESRQQRGNVKKESDCSKKKEFIQKQQQSTI